MTKTFQAIEVARRIARGEIVVELTRQDLALVIVELDAELADLRELAFAIHADIILTPRLLEAKDRLIADRYAKLAARAKAEDRARRKPDDPFSWWNVRFPVPVPTTFRDLYAQLSQFADVRPDHEAFDQPVMVRIVNDDDDDVHVGGLESVTLDAGCTETLALVLDAKPDKEAAFRLRAFYAQLSQLTAKHPDHKVLDQHVVVRVLDEEGALHVGGLMCITLASGYTSTWALMLDAPSSRVTS